MEIHWDATNQLDMRSGSTLKVGGNPQNGSWNSENDEKPLELGVLPSGKPIENCHL